MRPDHRADRSRGSVGYTESQSPLNRALVIFVGSDLLDETNWCSRLLKKGFKHCFLVLESEGAWYKIEGRHGFPYVKYIEAVSDYDMAEHYRKQGATVVETLVRQRRIYSPFVLRNCVGLVKAFIQTNSLALTPYQLYRSLR